MIQWVKWPQKWTVYLQETHLHVSCGKKRLLRCSVVSCLRNSCFPTAAWPFRKPRSELRLGFFEANTCKLTYSSAYDGVSEKCQKKHLQGVQEAFACLSTVPAKTNHASTTHLSTEAEGKSHDLKIHKHRRFLWEGIVWFSVFIDSQRKRVVVGEEENRRFLFFFLELRAFCCALALEGSFRSPMFSKKTKRKIKQLSVCVQVKIWATPKKSS